MFRIRMIDRDIASPNRSAMPMSLMAKSEMRFSTGLVSVARGLRCMTFMSSIQVLDDDVWLLLFKEGPADKQHKHSEPCDCL